MRAIYAITILTGAALASVPRTQSSAGGRRLDDPRPIYNLVEVVHTIGDRQQSWATDINDRGQVVGHYFTDGWLRRHAFVWQDGALTTILPQPHDATAVPAMLSPLRQLGASAINANGVVVGGCLNLEGRALEAAYFTVIPSAGRYPLQYAVRSQNFSSISTACDVTDGVPVAVVGMGRFGTIPARYRGIFVEIDPVTGDRRETELGTLGGGVSNVRAVNEAWTIVGGAETTALRLHAYVSHDRRTLIDLGTLGGAASEALDVNEAGEIVGWAEVASGREHAFLYRAGSMIDLGTLGGAGSRATAINDSGDVVGTAQRADGSMAAFLWRRGRMLDLGPLAAADGWALHHASAINNRGEIVGWGLHPDGSLQGFLLQPVDLSLSSLAPARAGVLNHLVAAGGVPGTPAVLLVGAAEPGYQALPACFGTAGLTLHAPIPIANATVDETGVARWRLEIPATAAGARFRLQVLALGDCRASPARVVGL